MGIVKVTANDLHDIVRGSIEDKKMSGAGITLITSHVPVIGAGYHLEMKPSLYKALSESIFPEQDLKAYFESMNRKLRNFAEPWQAEMSEKLNVGMFRDLIALNSTDKTLNGLIVGAYAKMDDFENLVDISSNDRTLLANCLRQLKSQILTLTEKEIYQENIFRMPNTPEGSEEEQRPQINAVYNRKTGESGIYTMLGDSVTRKGDIAEYRRRLHDTYAGLGNLINYYAGRQLYDTNRYMNGDILDNMIDHIDRKNK